MTLDILLNHKLFAKKSNVVLDKSGLSIWGTSYLKRGWKQTPAKLCVCYSGPCQLVLKLFEDP